MATASLVGKSSNQVKEEEMDGQNQQGIKAEEEVEVVPAPATKETHQLSSEDRVSVPESTILIPFDNQQAALTSYPPGCPVIHVDSTKNPPIVTVGKVQSVGFDMKASELVFRISPNHATSNDSFLVAEGQLSFAPHCPVKAEISDGAGTSSKTAIVLTGYHPLPSSEALYSIQDDSGSLYHGIPKSSVKYRPSEKDTGTASLRTETPSDISTASSTAKRLPPSSISVPAPASIHTARMTNVKPRTYAKMATGQTETMSCKVAAADPTSMPTAPVGKRSFAMQSNEQNIGDANLHSVADDADDQPATKRARNMVAAIVAESERFTDFNDKGNGRNASPENSFANGNSSKHDFDLVNNVPSDRHLTARAGEETRESEIVETRFVIPATAFDEDTMKEFFALTAESMMRETSCSLRLQFENRKMFAVVKGDKLKVDYAMSSLEESLLGVLDRYEKSRALFYMALLNEHRFWVPMMDNRRYKIVYQMCYHLTQRGMRYMHCRNLPRDADEVLPYAIGSRGSHKKHIMRSTKCTIEFNSESRVPHYVVYGDTTDDVENCVEQVEKSFRDARSKWKPVSPPRRRNSRR